MSDNDTSVLNSTYTNSSSSPDIRRPDPFQCVTIAVFVLSTITFIIGLSSWILIKKFRHFKNYLFLNIILNNVLNLVLGYFGTAVMESGSAVAVYAYMLPFLYFKMSAHCWLLVLCYVFYIELVNVFRGGVKWKYLKSTSFSWGLPLVIVVFDIFVMAHIDSSSEVAAITFVANLFLPLVISLLIYIRVLYALFMGDVHNNSDRCRRFQVATIIFLINGTLFLVMPLRFLVTFPKMLSLGLVCLQPVVMNLYFFAVRFNRTVWKKYYDRKIKSAFIPLNIKCQPK